MLLVDPISFYYWLLKVGLWSGSPAGGVSTTGRKTLNVLGDILFFCEYHFRKTPRLGLRQSPALLSGSDRLEDAISGHLLNRV